MTWILLLICLAVGGRELYTAYERRQASLRAADDKEVIEGLATRVGVLEASLAEAEARREGERAAAERDGGRIAALEEGHAEVAAAVADLHRDQVVRLEQDIERGTALRGLVRSDATDGRAALSGAYARCLSAYGLHVQAARRTVRGAAWSESYHLSGDGLAWLPRVLLGKARARDDETLLDLLTTVALTQGGLVRIGTFAAVRTPGGLLFGVTADGGSATTDHPDALAAELRSLPYDDRSTLDSVGDN